MTDTDDRDYFRNRARQERALAEEAPDLSARRAHLRLAEAYERKALGTEERAALFRPETPKRQPTPRDGILQG